MFSERCNSGFELRDNGCVQCDIGFYRDETESRLCVPCPGNKITQSKGAVSQALCTVGKPPRNSQITVFLNPVAVK